MSVATRSSHTPARWAPPELNTGQRVAILAAVPITAIFALGLAAQHYGLSPWAPVAGAYLGILLGILLNAAISLHRHRRQQRYLRSLADHSRGMDATMDRLDAVAERMSA